jgi:hypothetical protein
MARTITEDLDQAVKPGAALYDSDGFKVGYVDVADRTNGWMMVGAGELELKSLYVPYRLVTSADEREIYVSVTKEDLRNDYAKRPPRSTTVAQVEGKTIATTTEPSGYDGRPAFVREVNIDKVRHKVALGQQVWTSDETDVGTVKQFDATTGYMLVEKGVFSKHDFLLPISIVESVERGAGEIELVASKDDLERMQHLEPVNVVILPGGAA